jgi:hypothetical protein
MNLIMRHRNIIIYESLLNSLVVYQPKQKKVRYGTKGDGGYVIVDDNKYDLLIGCGINTDISFEIQFLENHPNISALLFDGTISGDDIVIPSQAKLIKKNISPINTEETTNLIFEVEPYSNVFLKMDIEWHEWRWIEAFNYFNKIKQMTIEFHGFLEEESDLIPKEKYKIFEKINETHFLVHVHANSCDLRKNDKLSNVMELTYIRKEDFLIEGVNKTPFPIEGLDYPNCGSEIMNLDFIPFYFSTKK